jgi:glycosyltransferase involved in cell wall biosynthesis
MEQFIAISDAVKKGLDEISRLKGDIDLIHQHDHRATRFGAARYASANSVPIIWTNHLADFFSAGEWPLHLFWSLSGHLPDGLIAVHQRTVEKISTSAWYNLPLKYIPNGVGQEFFLPEKEDNGTSVVSVNEETIQVFYPQRLVKEKGPEVLAEAVTLLSRDNELPGIHTLFAGSDPASNRSVQLVKRVRKMLEMHIQTGEVAFAGNPAYSEMPALYHQSDIVVLPLLKETENISVFEAWASRCTLIVTDVLERNAYIQHGINAFVVPSDNPGKLAEAIGLLAGDPELRNRLCDNGQKIVTEKFTWEQAANKTKQFYKEILEGGQNEQRKR